MPQLTDLIRQHGRWCVVGHVAGLAELDQQLGRGPYLCLTAVAPLCAEQALLTPTTHPRPNRGYAAA